MNTANAMHLQPGMAWRQLGISLALACDGTIVGIPNYGAAATEIFEAGPKTSNATDARSKSAWAKSTAVGTVPAFGCGRGAVYYPALRNLQAAQTRQPFVSGVSANSGNQAEGTDLETAGTAETTGETVLADGCRAADCTRRSEGSEQAAEYA
jgi:hypothetical protein